MIEIKEKSRDFSEIEQYLMTESANIITMKRVADGTEITVNGYILYDDDGDGSREPVEIMSIITPDKKVYAFQSATVKRRIYALEAIFKGKPYTVRKISGHSKKRDRDYLDLELKMDAENGNGNGNK